MTREEMIFEMAKAIAPAIVKQGVDTQMSIIRSGGNPKDCTIEGKDIPHAYGESLRIWATAFVDELNKK
jgi:hypothetical protein